MNQSKKTIPKIVSERLLIKGGKVVNHDHTFRADVFVENGLIRQVGLDLTVPGGVIVIDAKDALILPGGIDTSVNFAASSTWYDCHSNSDETTADDFYSGTRAALLGGTTTVFDFVTADKGGLTAGHQERADTCASSCCDVSLHVDVTSWNEDVKKSMTALAKEHGVNSFRIRSSDRFQLSDDQIFEVLLHIKTLGCMALVHAENGSLIRKLSQIEKSRGRTQPAGILTARNEDVELEAVNRVIIIAKQVSCPVLFINLTGIRAVNAIVDARKSGQQVYGQVNAVALYRNGSSYHQASWNKAAACITWPPLRDNPAAQQSLLDALSSGFIHCVSSGHCVFTNSSKSKLGKGDFSKIPPGTNGVYERMMAMWSNGVEKGIIDQNQFVAVTSTNAAKLFNLYPRKGHVAVGSDADLLVWRANEHRSLSASASALNVAKPDCSNAFDGAESSGAPVVVISRGKVILDENEVHVVQSHGTLLERPLKPPMVYNRLDVRDEIMKDLFVSAKSDTDVPVATPSVNGPRYRETNEDKPERFTRTSGHRAMHQSGWSFSGDQADDSHKRSTFRYSVPPGGLSNFSLN